MNHRLTVLRRRTGEGALATAYLLLDNLTEAQTCLEAVITPQTAMDTMGKRYCWARRAEPALLQEDPALALEILERLIASAPGMPAEGVITSLWMLKGEALAAMGRGQEACSLLLAAIENAQTLDERFLLWRAHASLGRLHGKMGRQAEAREELSTARELVGKLAATIPDKPLRDNLLQRADDMLGLD